MEQKKIIKWAALALVIGNLALVMYVVLGGATKKELRKPMPNPNGYDDFVKAMQVLKRDLNAENERTKRNVLADYARQNQEVFKLVEAGIKLNCATPNWPSDLPNEYVRTNMLPHLSGFKIITLCLLAKGRLAELEGRTNDGAETYLNGIQFGVKCGEGGVFIEKLTSAVCQNAASRPLEKLLPSLDAKECLHVARTLEALESDEESDEQVLDHEKEFQRVADTLAFRFARLIQFRSYKAMQDRIFVKLHASISERRKLALAFAARAYEFDKGKPPANAAALVPEYLKKVPLDPVTGKEMELNHQDTKAPRGS